MAIEVQPPTFKEALKQDRAQFDDCTPCRVVGALDPTTLDAVKHELTWLAGSATFVGLGAFTYVSGHSQLKAQEAAIRQSKSMFGMGSRRAAITTTSAVFVGLGVYRWFAAEIRALGTHAEDTTKCVIPEGANGQYVAKRREALAWNTGIAQQ
ncbi:hypothetical protein E8E12_008235 [Didymella heteroderae]|uniref:Uncharacterized protein n=1 Tax=Didymella heteroderae TaxID=1769908 RepID=A0A9P4WSI9_9PLEO|nr:hypothetical protein E8E12_008235 [Didymella heteroderae]